MTSTGREDVPDDERAPKPLRQLLDTGAYAAVVTGATTAASLVSGLGVAVVSGCAILSGLVFGKQILFAASFVILVYGAFEIRPGRSEDPGPIYTDPTDGAGGGGPDTDGAADGGQSADVRGSADAGRGPGAGTRPGSAGTLGTGRDRDGERNLRDPRDRRLAEVERLDDREWGIAGTVQSSMPDPLELDPDDRLSTGTKVVVSGFAVLLASFLLDLAGLFPANFPC